MEGVSSDGLGVYFEARQGEAVAGAMDVDRWVDLYNAYEQAGDQERAIQVANIAGNLPDPEGDRPMGLSVVTNSRIHSEQVSASRQKRGTHGITSYGKRMVRSCGAVLEERHGRANLTFGTCTLPALAEDEHELICAEWPRVVQRFFEEWTRLLERRGLDTDYVQVTEIQEKRFKKWGVIAPHLHFVSQGRMSRREFWRITPDEARSLWERVLSNVLGREVDGKAATRIERPKKSLAGELGKYISKGGKVVKAIISQGKSGMLPAAWWGAARSLKLEVQKSVNEYLGDVAEGLMDNLDSLREAGKLWFHRVYVELTDHLTDSKWDKCVGAVGGFISRAALLSAIPIAA